MKKLFPFIAATLLLGTLFLASCTKDDDPQAAPTSNDPKEKFRGNWSVAENSKDYGTSTYPCTVTDSSDGSHILFAYLYGFNKKTFATVSDNTVSIPSQVISGLAIAGSGTLANANRLELKFTVKSSSTHYDTVTAVLTK